MSFLSWSPTALRRVTRTGFSKVGGKVSRNDLKVVLFWKSVFKSNFLNPQPVGVTLWSFMILQLCVRRLRKRNIRIPSLFLWLYYYTSKYLRQTIRAALCCRSPAAVKSGCKVWSVGVGVWIALTPHSEKIQGVNQLNRCVEFACCHVTAVFIQVQFNSCHVSLISSKLAWDEDVNDICLCVIALW